MSTRCSTYDSDFCVVPPRYTLTVIFTSSSITSHCYVSSKHFRLSDQRPWRLPRQPQRWPTSRHRHLHAHHPCGHRLLSLRARKALLQKRRYQSLAFMVLHLLSSRCARESIAIERASVIERGDKSNADSRRKRNRLRAAAK